MECFKSNTTLAYFDGLLRQLKEEILNLIDRDLDGTDKTAWIDYFYAKYELEPVQIYGDKKDIDFNECKVKSYDTFLFNLTRGQEYIEVPGLHVTCKVLFTGSAVLFELEPMTHTLFHSFIVDRIIEPENGNYGEIYLSDNFEQRNVNAEQINKLFDDRINEFSQEIEYCNIDLNTYKEKLLDTINGALDKRIEQLDKLAGLRQSLCIPLNRIDNAPTARPVPLKRKTASFQRPKKTKEYEASYSISDKDYQYITEIIDNCCAMMEATPGSYKSLGEEQLRDHLLSLLNSHYENVGGETFRNKGKTDIFILCKDHAAYIAECKIWHGQKLFLEAIDQLFSYTTWRDTKVTVVVFNKENKRYEDVLNAIHKGLYERAIDVDRCKHSVWICRAVDNESQRVMHLTVQVFNLYS